MTSAFHVIIPARYHSTRLSNKLMLELNGLTVIERVYRQALQANPKSITIATDHAIIAEHATSFGADVIMTSEHHASGTDRVAEVVAKKEFPVEDIVVNVQGDEPFIPPQLIHQVAHSLHGSSIPMATLCWPLEREEQLHNRHVVKVVRDRNHQALYFSRSAIPANRDEPDNLKHVFRHIGLYAYRASFLLDFVTWPVCELESIEALEQLRVLWAGFPIKVETACVPAHQDINTEDDLIWAREFASV